MTLPNTSQLRTGLESLADCDSLAGPVLQMIGVVFAIQSAQAQAQKEITRFVKDIERTRQKFNDDDFRKKFSDEIQNLNLFDEAFKKAMQSDMSSLASSPYNSSMVSPDSFYLQNTGSFGMFPESGLGANDISKFSPMALTGSSPGGDCNSAGAGSLGEVKFSALDQTSSRFRRASASLAGIGMSLANDASRALDFATITSARLVENFTTRETILEDLEQSVSTLEDLLLSLEEDDYGLRFDDVISDAKKHVDRSIELTNSIIDDLAAGGAFQKSEKEELKDELQNAADELTVPSGFPRARGFQVFLFAQSIMVVMDQQLRLLKNLDSSIMLALPNLSSFSSSLQTNFKTANHYGGLFSVIRCGLRDISGQMDKARRRSDLGTVFSLIPRWRILLLTYKQMVDVSAQDPTTSINSAVASDFGQRLSAVEVKAQQALELVNQESMEDLIIKVRGFMSLAQTKLKSNISNTAVEAKAQIARNALTQAISDQTSIQDVLSQFIGDSPSEKARADAFFSVIEAAPYLYAITDAVLNGDWNQFFSADSLESSAKSLLGKYLAAASACCSNSNDVAAEAIREEASQQVQESRLEDISRKYVQDVSSRLQGSGITEILLLKSRMKRIQALLQLPCFGGAYQPRDVFAP